MPIIWNYHSAAWWNLVTISISSTYNDIHDAAELYATQVANNVLLGLATHLHTVHLSHISDAVSYHAMEDTVRRARPSQQSSGTYGYSVHPVREIRLLSIAVSR